MTKWYHIIRKSCFKGVLLCAMFYCHSIAVAQDLSVISEDTITVSASKVDILHYTSNPIKLLNDKGLYINQNAFGGLSTIQYRGMSSKQVPVIWNGNNIQSPHNGTYDLSLLSGINELNISDFQSTSDAIFINNRKEKMISLGYSTLNNMNIRGSYFLDNQVSQDLYFNVQNGENEYRYHHLGRELIQSEADNKSFDLMYGLTHKLSKATIKYDLWLQNRKRNVIPSDIAAYNNEVQKDKNLRLNVKLEVPISERRFMKFSMHSLSEQVLYTTPSINSDGKVLTNGFILNYKDISLIDLDFYYDKIISKANFFNENKTVNRSFIAINKSYQFKSVNLFGKLAKDFNTGLDLPITYQFKISHQIRNSNAFLQFSKNNIIPTLNDLYWPQGGNPDLKPELNYKAILGFETSLNNRLVDSIGIDIYHYQLKDRIIWIPQQNGFYTPENISAVISKGIDFHGSFSWLKKKDILFQTKINGSYNHNRISKDRNANNIGKSLIYQPEFNVVVANSLIFGKWVGTLVTNYTSKRPYLTDNSKYLASFVLFDVSLNYKLIDNLILNMDIYNVLNTDYQYINNYSMPLKYFDFNIKYTL